MLLTYARRNLTFPPPPPLTMARGIPIVEVNQRGGPVTSGLTTPTRVPNVHSYTVAHFRGSRMELDLEFWELIDGDEQKFTDFVNCMIWVSSKVDPNLADNAGASDSDGSPRVIQKTYNVPGGPGGIVVLSAPNCTVRVTYAPADTDGVLQDMQLEGDVKFKFPAADATVCGRGKHLIERAVTEDE